MSQIFDPAAFLDQTTEQAPERRNPPPALDFNANIKDVQMKTWEEQGQARRGGRC